MAWWEWTWKILHQFDKPEDAVVARACLKEQFYICPCVIFQVEMLNCWCCYVSHQLTVTSPSLYSVSGSELALARFRGAQPRDDCRPLLRKWRLPVFAPDLPPPMSDLALSQNQRDLTYIQFDIFIMCISSLAPVEASHYQYAKWVQHLWYLYDLWY